MVKKLPITREYWVDNKPDVEHSHFFSSFFIIDDIDYCNDKDVQKNLELFVNQIATRGRSHIINTPGGNISVAFINHKLKIGKNPRLGVVMEEATHFVIFPEYSSREKIKDFLKVYSNIDINEYIIREIEHNTDRWCLIHNKKPLYLISKNYSRVSNLNDDNYDMIMEKYNRKKGAKRKNK